MDKDSLLRQLSDYGYRVGFGAKKHFSTYDIISKVPGGISIIGLLIGVGQLAYPNYNYSTGISTILIMASIIGLTMSSYNTEKEIYNQVGQDLTRLFNELQALYYKVKNSPEQLFTTEVVQMNDILNRYYQISRSQQIFGSDWFAHYKFFWQMEKGWIEEQRPFRFWKDKIPKSLLFFIVVMFLVSWFWYFIFVRGA
ncbi:SLATT domain-containing protein [Fictibacillus phosphorivorans]|uniref:SLATT domain-containing protein n=1 Tax=Fictibacillus phosphorivorans TaxID=1221500 RepID=UPI001292EF13|nr:SLATT domain-containing protein [Fictibacillus phosphorivorans]MQR93716.1 SLATT domain-containing protein [Fictibacillus phosphorivorans]